MGSLSDDSHFERTESPHGTIYDLLAEGVRRGPFKVHTSAYDKYSRLRGSVICLDGIIRFFYLLGSWAGDVLFPLTFVWL